MHPYSVKNNGEISRFLTSGFVHADWGHLIINMYVLYMFGEQIEQAFSVIFGASMGPILFLILYIGAILAGNIPSYFKHGDNGHYRALGASGGTSGIVFAYVYFAPWAWFRFPPLPGILMAIGYLWYSSYMAKRGGDNIGHDAHFSGAVFGFFFMVVISFAFAPGLWENFFGQLLEGPSAPNFL